MERVLLFNLLHLVVSGYAMLRGGAPEKLTGGALLLATIATRLVQSSYETRFSGVEWAVCAVDVALLAVLVTIALWADRFWILWVVALHALGTGGHLVRPLDQQVFKVAYATLTAVWSYPVLLLLLLGTARHGRRLKSTGIDRDWSA